MKGIKRHMACRICDGQDLLTYMDYGFQPLANGLLDKPDQVHNLFPLSVTFCTFCGLSQLDQVVHPDILYSHYPYRSGISTRFKDSCVQLIDCTTGIQKSSYWVDIGSNDGTLLKLVKRRKECNVFGIEVCDALARESMDAGIETMSAAFSASTAKLLAGSGFRADVITAQNVLAHVNDLDSFLHGIQILLGQDGQFIFDVPYARDTIRYTQYDQFYHEHLSYFLLGPLDRVLQRHGLHIQHIDATTLHGGSIRVWCTKHHATYATTWIESEVREGFYTMQPYEGFAQRAYDRRQALLDLLEDCGPVAAVGAAAKGTVLLNFCGLTPKHVRYIVDDTPEKQGKYQPGTSIPISPRERLKADPVDKLLILPWNHAHEIMDKFPGYEYLVPNPPRLVSDVTQLPKEVVYAR